MGQLLDLPVPTNIITELEGQGDSIFILPRLPFVVGG
jgi:hypothetical protein